MKKDICFFLVAIFTVYNLFADDGWVQKSGGSYSLFCTENTAISMESERVCFTLEKDYYKTDIVFVFKNNGDSITATMGFPEYSPDLSGRNFVRHFKTEVNGISTNYTTEKSSDRNIGRWFVKEVSFAAGEQKICRVSYEGDYGQYGCSAKCIDYLYGTGSSWKGPIGSMIYEITNDYERTGAWLVNYFFPVPRIKKNTDGSSSVRGTLERTDDNTIMITAKDVNPESSDCFSVILSFYPSYIPAPRSVSRKYNSWEYYDRLIPDKDLLLLNKEQLYIMRNFIYAFYGYTFKDEKLENYFKNEDWYVPDTAYSDACLSDTDRKNIQRIRQEEAQRMQ